jgi:uncharacterized protein
MKQQVKIMTLTDQSWVLVTGASSGFGEEFARQYAAQGRPLVLVARRIEKLQTLATELRERYRVDVIIEQVDLSNVAAVIQLHQRLRERGIAIDILINNAGHGLQGTFVDGTLDAALAMLQLDVVSLTAVTHLFAQDMRTRGGGKILLVASLLAYQGVEKFAVYAAAKAYVLRLGEALHRELKRDGVTVTVLCPGMSDTGFATAAQQKITPALKLLMMQPAPVVRAGIRALQARRISVVPGWANKATVMFTRATPRWLHQAVFSRIMGAATDRGDAHRVGQGRATKGGAPMTTTMSELKRKSASRSDRERASQRVDFNLSSKSSFPGPPGDIECGIVRPAKTVMGDFLVDAEALLAARLERVSLDDISRQAQPNPLHPQHGAYHHG